MNIAHSYYSYSAGQLSVTLLNGHFPKVVYLGISYNPDPYVILTIGGESWTSSTQDGKDVTFNQGHSFLSDYGYTVRYLEPRILELFVIHNRLR